MSTTTNESFLQVTSSAAIVEAETYESVAPSAVTITDPHSAASEQYKMLRYRLEVLAKSGIKALAFTSALSGEGKTTTAVNTALALGRGGKNRVCLVDGDLRAPGVHTLLGLRPREGLCDVVAGRASLSDCMWRFGQDELYVLPAGNVPDDLARTLYDPRLTSTLGELKTKFDFVVVDAPPVLAIADVPTMCRDLDGAILVVRAGKTPGETVSAAMEALYGVTIHGVVLNDIDAKAQAIPYLLAPSHMRALPPKRG